ncbi:MAG: chromate transporter [Sarcina sp.]|nr:chromate transporter [Sarcina sp.]
MKELLELYLAFLKIGAVNFGGGYAMLPLLERDLVQSRGWTTTDDLTDYFAIGQCTPGLIALNVATFIGSRRKGVAGAIAATVGFVSMPIVIILLIATFLQGFADLPVVQNAFAGIRVCVCVLIIQAVLRLWKKSVVDKTTLVLYLAVFLMTALSGVLPLAVPAALLVIISGALGVIIGALRDEKAGMAGLNGKTSVNEKASMNGKASTKGKTSANDKTSGSGKEADK